MAIVTTDSSSRRWCRPRTPPFYAKPDFFARFSTQAKPTPGIVLFNCDGLCQITWLVYVAAAPHGDMVGQELQGDDFQDGRHDFRRSGNFNGVVRSFSRKLVAFSDD